MRRYNRVETYIFLHILGAGCVNVSCKRVLKPASVKAMRIAIAGVGGIGKHILDALIRTPHSICALSTRVCSRLKGND